MMKTVKLDNENAKGVAALMHAIKPEWWPDIEDAYGQLTDINESIGTVGWFLEDDNGTPVGWTLFRKLKGYLALELECCGFNDNGVFKLEHKLRDLLDRASEYARSKGYTALKTGMSSADFSIDGKELPDIPAAIRSLETDRIDYQWLLDYGFQVIGIHPNAYGHNRHLIMFLKAL